MSPRLNWPTSVCEKWSRKLQCFNAENYLVRNICRFSSFHNILCHSVTGVTPVTLFIWQKNNCKQNLRLEKSAENCNKSFWPIVTVSGAGSVTGVTVEQVDNVFSSLLNNNGDQRNTLERIREIQCWNPKKYNWKSSVDASRVTGVRVEQVDNPQSHPF